MPKKTERADNEIPIFQFCDAIRIVHVAAIASHSPQEQSSQLPE